MRPCGMCVRLCATCKDRHDRLHAEYEQQGKHVAALEIAFAEAHDGERDAIAERLEEAIELWWQIGEDLDELRGPADG